MNRPRLEGKLAVEGLSLSRFELGSLKAGSVEFEPLWVKFKDVRGSKNAMEYASKLAELRFDGKAPLELSMDMASEKVNVPEVIRTLHFDEDPRFRDLDGHGKTRADVKYVIGGPDDVCDGGRLRINADLALTDLLLLDEKFGPASGAFRLDWFDIAAGTRGMDLKIDGVRLGKGSGAIYGNAHVGAEAKIEGEFLATRIPVGRIDAFGSSMALAEGYVTGNAKVDGRLDVMHVLAHANMSELGVAGSSFPASVFEVELVPKELPLRTTGLESGCKRPILAEFSQAEYDKDESEGDIVVRGSFFGGQASTQNLSVSRQRARVWRGDVRLTDLNVGALLAFGAADGDLPFQGHLSGALNLERFSASTPLDSQASFQVSKLLLRRAGYSALTSEEGAKITLGSEGVRLHGSSFLFRTPRDEEAKLEASGLLARDLSVVATLRMPKTPLATFLRPFDSVESAEGSLFAGLDVTGNLKAPILTGYLEVEAGKIQLTALKPPITDINVRVQVGQSGVSVEEGSARLGGGALRLRGGAPLVLGSLGDMRLSLEASDVNLPLGSDVRASLDADLTLDVPKARGELPKLSGRVDVDGAHYERVMNMTADLASIGSRGKKTDIVDVDPEDARLALDVVFFSRRPLELKNQLVSASLSIDPGGVRISGTDKKFGAVGNVGVLTGGSIVLRQNKFEIQTGIVRFTDPVELRPEVDVTATSEFRRNQGVNAFGSSAATQAGTSSAGNYRISLHAYGAPDDIKIDLTSDPPLPQDDIFLLLTIGLTRRELDRTQNSGVGSSAALEALGTLTGAESAVSSVVKVDEFRFGSTYSSRTGRTEPTVTIGKRLSDRIRASVTSSISEANELRSNIEYQATPHLSVEGSYDNAQRSGGPTMGNIGGDVRWRLEFD
jgi:translocation and assembly module TamB